MHARLDNSIPRQNQDSVLPNLRPRYVETKVSRQRMRPRHEVQDSSRPSLFGINPKVRKK